jgi:hypothetical protein
MTEMNATATENINEIQAARFDLVEQLARKMSISLEAAKAALEAADWNMLTATHLLEQEEFCRKQQLNEVAEGCVVVDDAAQDSAAAGKAATVDETAKDRIVTRHTAPKPKKWFSNLRDHLHRLLAFGNHNRFTIFKDGEQLLEMPVTALALLLFFSFGTCAILMVVGLFAGCRYSLTAAAEA